jgi:hypothetical protein
MTRRWRKWIRTNQRHLQELVYTNMDNRYFVRVILGRLEGWRKQSVWSNRHRLASACVTWEWRCLLADVIHNTQYVSNAPQLSEPPCNLSTFLTLPCVGFIMPQLCSTFCVYLFWALYKTQFSGSNCQGWRQLSSGRWRFVVRDVYGRFGKTAASVWVDLNWWWRQHISPKYRYISTLYRSTFWCLKVDPNRIVSCTVTMNLV